jgi:4-hydroxybenzoate polyprenyltransferase
MIRGLLLSMRPRQWTKNLVVFAGIAFAQKLVSDQLILRTLIAFGLFCLASGGVYLLNDVLDREKDMEHPLKRKRPVASGMVPVSVASGTAAAALVAACVGGWLTSSRLGWVILGYEALMVSYSLWLKHFVIIDVLAIAAGFVLRAVGGAVVVTVDISSWLLVCTVFLALFLGLSKRRHELVLLDDRAQYHRRSLVEYSPALLDQMISVATASTILAYSLYTMSPQTIAKFGTARLAYTIPFVLYGILRYLYLVYRKDEGGSPERALLADRPLLADVALWIVIVGLILYR